MTSDLVAYTHPSPDEWQQTLALVDRVATTEFVPTAMRGKPGAVLASILTGRELGIGPMQSLKHIRPVEGTPGLSAELMAGLVRSRGHKLRIITRAVDEAEVEGVRSDDPQHPLRVTWTLKDAERARLCRIGDDGKPIARSQNGKPMPWELHPDALLLARAISAVCRALFSDVLAGFAHTPEELEAGREQTETAWGEVEVDTETGEVSPGVGAVTMTPAPAPATTQGMPSLDQIKRLRSKDEATDLVRAHHGFAAYVSQAITEMHGVGPEVDWWPRASVRERREVLEYAVELADQQQHETSGVADPDGPPAGTATPDPTSPPAQTAPGKGDQAGGDDPQGGE